MLEASIGEAGYGSRRVLREIAVSLDNGERILVVGASGSGKTTLLLAVTGVLTNLLNGYVKGSVVMKGFNPLMEDGFLKVPRHAGFVLQDPDKQLAMPTPLDEVMFTLENLGWPEGEAERRAREMLKAFGLAGYEFEWVENLSGGLKRRLTLASSLAHDPDILFLDEPTASIDPWGLAEIRGFMRRLGGKGVVVIEHKALYFLDMVDKVIAIRDGTKLWESHPGSPGIVEQLQEAGADAGGYTINPPRSSQGEVVLEASGVEAGYRGRTVVKLPELTVRKGEVVALVGPNGGGKTTLLKVLAGIVEPIAGEIRPGGKRFYMPQHPDYMFLFNTVAREVEEVRKVTGVDVTSLPGFEWISGILDMSPYRLSHGQRRWLAFAIALAYRASLYLLDEPTTGMDVSLYRTFGRILEDLRRDAGVIVATHDIRVVAEYADRVYMVMDGVAREVGKEYAVRLLDEAWRS